ncbi:hypothetical protein GJ744_000887 [Endocarpon pusillum]|uniref:Uncharacterized protein n=1 Tax=Endocarpon pusillum TaxID=364733 RepID=A0A8H7AT14_9EURO|nr:hypothetical protein GJ744_000887 [Endocarpon pusillum]
MMLPKSKPNESDSSDLSDLELSARISKSSKKSSKPKDKEQELVIRCKHRPSNACSISTGGPEIITATPRTRKRVSFYDRSQTL